LADSLIFKERNTVQPVLIYTIEIATMAIIESLALGWLGSGLLVASFGALIKFAGWTWLLAGYSESTSKVPDNVVRDIAGNTLLRLGIAVFIFGVITSVIDLPGYVLILVTGIILVAVGRLIYRLNTWSPPNRDSNNA
jgi:hypothetical protein